MPCSRATSTARTTAIKKILRFARGDTITFKTYKQGADTLGGAALHWVGYDEPPPVSTATSAMMRLATTAAMRCSR
jgi:hypothetical protein